MSKTHFGFQTVDEQEKAQKVAGVFHSVAANYDLMNDLMSGGLHRAWKIFTIAQANVRTGYKVLDIAGGTGDLSKEFAKKAGPTGEVWHTDINESMLRVGRDRLLDKGIITPALLCDAEKIPFPDNYFDVVTVAFGLRNMTHKDVALAEMRRVLKPGGRLLVLEFSKVWDPLKKVYDVYSFKVLPWLGDRFAKDAESYRYLAESIRMHPDQETLKTMMEQAGLDAVKYYNLSAGVVALHVGTNTRVPNPSIFKGKCIMSDSRLLSTHRNSGSLARRIGLAAMVGLIAFATVASLDAEARRMGGGRSIGRQQSSTMQRQTTPPAQPTQPTQQAAQPQRAQPAPAPAAAPARSRWLGPIAGLAAGLGIAALLSHFGMGEAFAGAMANLLVVAAIAFLAIWLIRRFMGRKRDAAAPAYAAGSMGSSPNLNAGRTDYSQEPSFTAPPTGSVLDPQGNPLTTPVINTASTVPANFDSAAFVRNAKVYFVRLQAAWDVGNMEDIREFTTPEMFAEVKVDLDSRGGESNLTDVVQLNAELLGVEDRGSEYLASVRFSGLIRESSGAPAGPFAEIWNLSKSTRAGEGWLLAGIQQVDNAHPAH